MRTHLWQRFNVPLHFLLVVDFLALFPGSTVWHRLHTLFYVSIGSLRSCDWLNEIILILDEAQSIHYYIFFIEFSFLSN